MKILKRLSPLIGRLSGADNDDSDGDSNASTAVLCDYILTYCCVTEDCVIIISI